MATDPVERIRAFAHDTPLALDLTATLQRLASLPPSPVAPYLTLCLDWRPEGSEPGRLPAPRPKRSERRAAPDEPGLPRRPSWQEAQRELEALVARYGPRGEAFESLSADAAHIAAYLDGELDPAARGVVIVACQQQGVFEAIPLDVAVPTGITIGAVPSLRQLVRVAEDQPAYAVLVADQVAAFLWLMERQTLASGVELEANDYPRRQQTGGLSQRRLANRAEERVDAFARTVAQETRQALGEGEGAIGSLIIAAEEPMFSALSAAFHQTVAERIIGRVRLPIDAAIAQVAAAARPLLDDAERQRELAAVQAVRDGVGANTDAVAGAADTVTALQSGGVMSLVMNDDFAARGWADYTLPLFGVGDVPRVHPAGGDAANLTPVPLADEAIRLALLTNAAVDLVQSEAPAEADAQGQTPRAGDPTPRSAAARALDELGGIGAILRFARGQERAEVAGA